MLNDVLTKNVINLVGALNDEGNELDPSLKNDLLLTVASLVDGLKTKPSGKIVLNYRELDGSGRPHGKMKVTTVDDNPGLMTAEAGEVAEPLLTLTPDTGVINHMIVEWMRSPGFDEIIQTLSRRIPLLKYNSTSRVDGSITLNHEELSSIIKESVSGAVAQEMASLRGSPLANALRSAVGLKVRRHEPIQHVEATGGGGNKTKKRKSNKKKRKSYNTKKRKSIKQKKPNNGQNKSKI